MITFRLGFPERRYAGGQIRLTAPSGRRAVLAVGSGSDPPAPLACYMCTHPRARGSLRAGERIQRATQRHHIPPSHRRRAAHCRRKRPKERRQERAAWGDGEVHAQVQGGGRRGRRGGHAGRRRPDPVPGGRGQRRRLQEEAAAATRLAVGLVVPTSRPGRELLPEAAEPHAVHGPARACIGVGCSRRARAGAAAPGRPLALLQHGVVRRRVGRGAGQEPAVMRLRRRCQHQGRRSGGLGEQQRGQRRQPREARDDAVQPFPRRPERPGVGSGGAEQRPVVAATNADRPGSARREVEDPAGGRDRGVLRGRRGGRGQALRLQVQLRRRPRRAPRLRPVRVDPGGEQQLAISKRGSAWACKGGREAVARKLLTVELGRRPAGRPCRKAKGKRCSGKKKKKHYSLTNQPTTDSSTTFSFTHSLTYSHHYHLTSPHTPLILIFFQQQQ